MGRPRRTAAGYEIPDDQTGKTFTARPHFDLDCIIVEERTPHMPAAPR